MSVFFSKECEYAIQSVMYLAQKPYGELSSIKEISGRLKIPSAFLAKIFQKLSRKKILRSVKGVSGGFGLAKSADKMKLYDIVDSIDGAEALSSCFLGFKDCGENAPCPMHSDWKKMREQLRLTLTTKSIYELTKNLHKKGYLNN